MKCRLSVAAVVAVGVCLAVPLAAQNQAPAPPDRAKVLSAARELMAKAVFCTMTTVDAEGQPRARVVQPFEPDENMTIWIGTKATTRKVAQLRTNPRVTLLYYDTSRMAYVTLIGKGEIVTDAAEKAKRWKAPWTTMVKDEKDFVLVRFTPVRLELLNPSQGMGSDPTTWEPVGLDLGLRK